MNKVYRVIFNRALGVYQCVCEFAKAAGKTKSIKTLSVAVAIALSGQAMAEYQTYQDQTQRLADTYNASGDLVQRSNLQGHIINVKKGNFNVFDSSTLKSNLLRTEDGTQTTIDNNSKLLSGQVSGEILLRGASSLTLSNQSQSQNSALLIGADNKVVEKTSLVKVDGRSNINTGEIFVGYLNQGELHIGKDSQVTVSDHLNIGHSAQGKVSIAGTNSVLNAKNFNRPTQIAGNRQGQLLIQNGGIANLGNFMIGIKTNNQANNLILVEGKDSQLNAEGQALIGMATHAKLEIKDRAKASLDNLVVANSGSNTQGTVLVTGNNTTLNVKNATTVGRQGQGTLTVADGAIAEFKNGLTIAKEGNSNSTFNLNGNGGFANNSYVNVAGADLTVGDAGNGMLNITNEAALVVGNNAIVGKTGKGRLNLDGGNLIVAGASAARYGNVVLGELDGSHGTLNATEGARLSTKNLIIGQAKSATGEATFDGSEATIYNDLNIGKHGTGKLTINNQASVNVKGITYLGDKTDNNNSHATLTINNATLQSPNFIIGNGKSTTINLNQGSVLKTRFIERVANDQNHVRINLDGATLTANDTDSNVYILSYFDKFTPNDTIHIGKNGVTFAAKTGEQITLGLDARITGEGGIAKTGTGKLIFSANNKQWQGGLHIEQGEVAVKGNYFMQDNEVLGIGVNSLADYGKLDISGTADISRGILKIKTADTLKKLEKGKLADVLTAKQLTGQFKKVENNNPLIDFRADYSDKNKVHLVVGLPEVEKVPNNPPTVEKPIAEIGKSSDNPPIVNLPNAEIGKSSDNPPTVEKPIADIPLTPLNPALPVPPKKPEVGKSSDNPPIVNLPNAEIGKSSDNPPTIEKPIAEIGKSSDNPPIVNLPNAEIGKSSDNPPTVEKPIAEIPLTPLNPALPVPPKKPDVVPPKKPEVGKSSDNPPIVNLPNAEIGKSSDNPPTVEKPIAEIGKSSDNPPTVNKPNAVPLTPLTPAPKKPDATPKKPDVAQPKQPDATPPKETPKPKEPTPPAKPKPMPKPAPKPALTPFAQAASELSSERLLNLAHVLDNAYFDVYQDLSQGKTAKNALGLALISDSDGLKGATPTQTQANLNQINLQLQPLLMGAVNDNLLDTYAQNSEIIKAQQASPAKQGAWTSIYHSRSQQDNGTGGLMGHQDSNQGLAFGGTAHFGNITAGAAFSYANNRTQGNTAKHLADNKTYLASVYANADFGTTAVYGQLNAGQAQIQGERHLDILKAGVAKSDYQAKIAGGSLGVRHRFGIAQGFVAPFVDVDFATVQSDGYQETGTRYNLTVAKQRTHRLFSRLGADVQYNITPYLAIAGTVAGTYHHGEQNQITAQFSDTPNTRFSTLGHKARHTGLAKLGVNYQLTPNASVGVHYQGQWQQGQRHQGVNAGAKLTF